MNHQDHVNLIREGVAPGGVSPAPGSLWADLGSGGGAFTLALADLAGPRVRILSLDRDRPALRAQEQAMRAHFPDRSVEYRLADFTRPQDLPSLDGIVMANALHFIPDRDKPRVLGLLRGYLKPGGRLVLVEYNSDHGNLWVPHPLSYPTWEKLAGQAGFLQTRRLASVPSRFLNEIYSALSLTA
ncbi:MAG TPA: class I SAM-dependent methyltransferase [Anaerolineaceae bacterium]|nr:class I SAM-dependent methyltransferase [Anaerolineaceae bacterium]